jgi:hypothetical protein
MLYTTLVTRPCIILDQQVKLCTAKQSSLYLTTVCDKEKRFITPAPAYHRVNSGWHHPVDHLVPIL